MRSPLGIFRALCRRLSGYLNISGALSVARPDPCRPGTLSSSRALSVALGCSVWRFWRCSDSRALSVPFDPSQHLSRSLSSYRALSIVFGLSRYLTCSFSRSRALSKRWTKKISRRSRWSFTGEHINSNQNQIWRANIGGYIIFGFILSYDCSYHTGPPSNSGTTS